MSETEPQSTDTTDGQADDRIAERFVVGFGVIGLLCSLVAVVMLFGHVGEQYRESRIAAAETKYDVTYLRSSKDGEGGGLWRLDDGTVVPCRISGAAADPTLACGEDGDEPTRS